MERTNQLEKRLIAKIKSQKAKVGIIGLGYVGLPIAIAFAKAGFQITGFDRDHQKIKNLRTGVSHTGDVLNSEVVECVSKNLFLPTGDEHNLSKCDAIIICVPTPLNKTKEPDISFVLNAAQTIKRQFQKGQLVVLESTVYPGTTEEIIQAELETNRIRVGKDFFLCFSPERIDPGNREYPLRKIPKVIGGTTPVCTRVASLLYQQIVDQVIPVSSPRVAEMTKLLENTFRIVNIGLVNELVSVADRLGINLWEVIDAAKSKPFGFMPFYPGPGIGGHCIGIDPLYLSWKARLVGSELRFVELARRINASMPSYVVRRISELLNSKGKAVKHSKILVVGVAYKKDVSDVRESPAIEILEQLSKLGGEMSFHDPHVRTIQFNGERLSSQALTVKMLKRCDLVVIVTPHSNLDYRLLLQHSQLLFDSRNALSRIAKHSRGKVVLL